MAHGISTSQSNELSPVVLAGTADTPPTSPTTGVGALIGLARLLGRQVARDQHALVLRQTDGGDR